MGLGPGLQESLEGSIKPIIEKVGPALKEVAAGHQEEVAAANEAVAVSASFLRQLWEDSRLWWFGGGLLVGGYFGFRVGGVSERAHTWVASRRYMRAAALSSYQGVKGVSVQDVEEPEIVHPSQILIEVRAASLDPVDLKVSQGFGRGLRELVNRYNPNTGSQFPVILGRDGTGVVKEVGGEVEGLKPGDRVWFVVPHCLQGSLSTLMVLDRQYVRPLPHSLSFEGGATLPYCGMLAWDMLVTAGGLGPEEKSRGKEVFVWGGVRALERLAVQLCVHWGCKVTCVAPLYTHQYLTSLGATTVVTDDMAELGKLAAAGSRFDVVVNTAGLLAEDLCLALTKMEGRVVTALTQPPGMREYGVVSGLVATAINFVVDIFRDNLWGGDRVWGSTKLRGEVLDYLGQLVLQGAIDPVGERIYTLEQSEIAFRELAAGGHKGKLVIRMGEPGPEEQHHQLALLG